MILGPASNACRHGSALMSIIEEDDLAIALAAGRYASMKLAKLTGEESTKNFFNECIKTTLNHNNLQ